MSTLPSAGKISPLLITTASLLLLGLIGWGAYQLRPGLSTTNQAAVSPTPSTASVSPTPVQATTGYVIAETSGATATFSRILSGSAKTELFSLPIKEEEVGFWTPAGDVAPDGKSIVYLDSDGSLLSYDLTSSKSTVLKASQDATESSVSTALSFNGVTFSPDGKKLGLNWRGWEASGLALINGDGSDFQQFTRGYGSGSLAFSPDSQRLAIASTYGSFGGGEDARLYVADVAAPDDGKDILPKELHFAEGNRNKDTYTPAWSPDGSKIAFAYKYLDNGLLDETNTNAEKYRGIYAIKVDGSDFHQVSNNQSFSSEPFWRDNDTIAYGLSRIYSGNRQGIFSIADNGEANALLYSGTATSYRPVSLSPDRKLLAYRYGSPETSYEKLESLGILNLETRENATLGKATFIGWVR